MVILPGIQSRRAKAEAGGEAAGVILVEPLKTAGKNLGLPWRVMVVLSWLGWLTRQQKTEPSI